MNKSELVTLLRDPGTLTSNQLDEIELIVQENPYFLSARLLLAKGSKEIKHPQTKKRVTSAAVYSTDRILLKKYLSGNLFFLNQSPVEAKPERQKVVTASEQANIREKPESRREDKKPKAPIEKKKPTLKVPNVPTGDLDDILEELKQDMKNLKSSRAHFVEVQQNIVKEDEINSVKESIEKDFEVELNEAETKEIATIEKGSLQENRIVEEEKVVPREKEENKDKNEAEENNKKAENEKLAEKKKPVRRTTKKTSVKEVSPEEEDEIVSKKLAELAKKQEIEKEEKNPATERKTKSKVNEEAKKEEKPKKPIRKTKVKEESEIKAKRNEEDRNSEASESNERAKDPFRETRFAKDATRSYLRKLDPPEDFPFFDDTNDEVPIRPDKLTEETTTAKEAEKPTEEEESTKSKEERLEPKIENQEVEKEEPTLKKETKEENKPTESKITSSLTKSSDSVMPKGSIMKKAKLVKSKRSSRRSNSGSVKPLKSDKGSEDDGKSDPADQKQIIDKFIKESPSIKYSREPQQSTADLAESSGTWDKSLASEYLAEIYLKQGNKKRAIEIYEVLSLKYPEKKSYFADLISKSK